MNRRSFLATLCAVTVAPLVAVAAPPSSTTLTITDTRTVGDLVGQIVYCVNGSNPHGEYLRVIDMRDNLLTYERVR